MNSVTPDLQALLQNGIAAIRQGRREAGRELLMQVIAQNDQIETAWLWLSVAVDQLADKQVALENALTLNPANTAAQKQLEQIRLALAPPVPEPQPPPTTHPEVAPAAQPEAAPMAQPDIQHLAGAPLETNDGIDDEFQCPYCGRPTAPADRRCAHCQQKLYRHVAQSDSSEFLTTTLVLLVISLFVGLLGSLSVFLALGGTGPGVSPALQSVAEYYGVKYFIGDFFKLSTATARWLALGLIIRTGLLGGVLIGLKQRWGIVYYAAFPILLVNLFFILFMVINVYSGVVAGLLDLVLTIIMAALLFGSNREFAVNEERLLTRPDPQGRSALDFFRRGQAYSDQGMWALAVAQWRKAVGLAPAEALYYKDLGIGYAQIRRFDRSLRTLAEAERRAPHDRQIQAALALIRQQAAQADPGHPGGSYDYTR